MATGDNKGPTIIGVTMMLEAFAVVALGMRFWSRQIVRRQVALHDVLNLFGLLCATALAICLVASVEYGGLGRHSIELVDTPWKLITFGKLLIAIQVLWAFGMTSIRLSMLNMYIHLFSSATRFRRACYVMMCVCAAWCIGEIVTVFLLCRPFQHNWDKTVSGSCGNLNAAYLAVHSTNFAIDLSIALLPLRVLWGLKIATAKKLGSMVMFALGALICAISVARIAMYQLALAYDQSDFTYTGSILYLFTAMEPLIACSLSCMPLLRPALEKADISLVSWAKSLVRTSQPTKDLSAPGPGGYLGMDSTDGLQHEARAIGGG